MFQETKSRLKQATGCLSPPLLQVLMPHISELENKVQEIRLRVNRPVTVIGTGGSRYFTLGGTLTDLPCGELLIAQKSDLAETLQRACDYSVYARQRELREGFLTLRGGHRLGVCGTAVQQEGEVVNVRDLSSLNLRVAREHRGCAGKILSDVCQTRGGLLLCGAPCSGKTTLLRDLARLLSLQGLNVSLIDERGELAATCSGEPQNDVGFCDVFDGYPKAEAMMQALRCMSPQLIICDEIGGEDDAAAIEQCVGSGVRLIATAHAGSQAELFGRKNLKSILSSGAFSTLVFLTGRSRAGTVSGVVDLDERLAA